MAILHLHALQNPTLSKTFKTCQCGIHQNCVFPFAPYLYSKCHNSKYYFSELKKISNDQSYYTIALFNEFDDYGIKSSETAPLSALHCLLASGELHGGIYKGLGWHLVYAELIQNTKHELKECQHSLVLQQQQLKYDSFPVYHLAAEWGCVTVWFCLVPIPLLPVCNNSHRINTVLLTKETWSRNLLHVNILIIQAGMLIMN